MSIRVTDFPTGPPLQGSIPKSAISIKEEIATLELYIQQLKTYQHKIKDRPETNCTFSAKNKENFDCSNSRFALKQENVLLDTDNDRVSCIKVPYELEDIAVIEEEIITNVNQSSPDVSTDCKPYFKPDRLRTSKRAVTGKFRKLKTLVIPSKKLLVSKQRVRKLSKEQIIKEHSYSLPDKSKSNVILRHLGQYSWSRLGPSDRQYLCKLLNSFVNHCYSRQARRQILRKLGLSQSSNEIFNLVTERFNSNRLNQIERTLDLGKTTCCHKAHLSSQFLAPVSRLKLPEYSKHCSKLLREFQVVTPVSTRKSLVGTGGIMTKHRPRPIYHSDTFNSRSLRRRN